MGLRWKIVLFEMSYSCDYIQMGSGVPSFAWCLLRPHRDHPWSTSSHNWGQLPYSLIDVHR